MKRPGSKESYKEHSKNWAPWNQQTLNGKKPIRNTFNSLLMEAVGLVGNWFGLNSNNIFNKATRDETRRILEKVDRLARKIVDDFMRKQDIATPTTGAEASLQSYINSINTKYTQEAYDIQKTIQEMTDDLNKVDQDADSYSKSIHDNTVNSNYLKNEAQQYDKQATAHLANAQHKASQNIVKATNYVQHGNRDAVRRQHGLQKKI